MNALALKLDLLVEAMAYPQGSRRAWALELVRDAPDYPLNYYMSDDEEEETLLGTILRRGTLPSLTCVTG